MSDEKFMERCFELAARGEVEVGNGAVVGAVLVRKGAILAEGWHAGFGLPHAERALFEAFEGDVLSGDVLYVNLEPCCPSATKKTLPCTEVILSRGVREIVYGMEDPDPRVSGKGLQLLRDHGVLVRGPVREAEARALNRGFVSLRTRGRPWTVWLDELRRHPPKQISCAIGDTSIPDWLTVRHFLSVASGRIEWQGVVYPVSQLSELLSKLGTPRIDWKGTGLVHLLGTPHFHAQVAEMVDDFE